MGPAPLQMHLLAALVAWSSCRWQSGLGQGGTNGQEGGKGEYAGGKALPEEEETGLTGPYPL